MSKLPPAGRALIASAMLALAIPATAQHKEASNVVDPYLWLEDVTGDKALDWARAQNARTDAELAAGPGFAKLQSQILAILDSDAKIPDVSKIGDYYYNFWKDAQHERGLWRRTTLAEYRKAEPEWETVIDLDALNKAEGENWVWHGADCLKPAYQRCLVALSRGGADADVTREFDLSTKQWVEGGFFRPEAKGGLGWIDRDNVFVFTDFGDGSMTASGYPRIVKTLQRGAPLASAKTVYEGKPDDMYIAGYHDDTPGFERNFVSRTLAFYNDELYLLGGDGKLAKIDAPNSASKSVHKDWLLLQLREPMSAGGTDYAAGSLLAADFDAYMAGERKFDVLFAPTDTTSLDAYTWTKSHLVLNVLDDVKNRLSVLTPGANGWTRSEFVGAPDIGTIGLRAVDADESDAVWLTATNYLSPSTLSLVEIGKAPEQLKSMPVFFDASGLVSEQFFATSKDGTRVPYFIVHRKDLAHDGTAPTLLYGYGGFEVSLTPGYNGTAGKAWMEQGGVWVVANIRGGGEYGPRWHQAALKQNRHKAYEDFAAVARDLVARKITSPRHLGAMGGSNGGLLTGNMLTQYPELFGAIVIQVPLLDMKRYSHLLAGASWMAEYGDPDTSDWDYIKTFSAYHLFDPSKDYPPTFIWTTTRDDRVHPGHARKMAAKMLAAGKDVRYYENTEGGHGAGATNAQSAHVWALTYRFLWDKLSGKDIPMTNDSSTLTPPDVARKPHTVTAPFGAQRQDEYYWLRDDTRKSPEMLAYLNAENAYADTVMAPLKQVEDTLYDEIVGRIKQDDSSVPYRERGWWYYSRYETGQDYPIHARRPDVMGAYDESAREEVLLDVNTMAEGKDYFSVGDYAVSQDNAILAWAEDGVGRRQYTIRFRNLATGEVYPDVVTGVSPNLVWADDNRTLFYVEKDPETLLTVRVRKHVLGTPVAADPLVYEEKDDSFYMGIDRTRDDRFICIEVESTVSSETRCAPAANPEAFTVLAPRARDVEYQADHLGDRWVIRTNDKGASNFKLVTAPSDATSRADWTDLVPHRDDVYIEGYDLFDDFIAIGERSGGLERIRMLNADGSDEFVKADETAYSMGLSTNSEPDTDWLRYGYTSLTTPQTTYELNVKTGERRMLKQQPVIGYDPSKYETQRLWATARDGTRVPVTVVHRKDFKRDGTAALLQYAYGSYGSSTDPGFNLTVVSLLDRGMVYALAHIRGGQEMGRAWYDDGKLLNKKNTFTDFIDVTDFLVKEGYAAPDRVAAYGGSAGGLLVGAVANMAPDKYRVILSQVPFVDVVTTMLDASIPLTTNEYDEWGNPEQKQYYDYMLSYSPYDNLAKRDYPAMFIGTGLWDSQVQYWEPAKYVARLRDVDTGGETIVFRTNMDAGHGGKSGRFRRYRERAEMYAFMLDQLGVAGR